MGAVRPGPSGSPAGGPALTGAISGRNVRKSVVSRLELEIESTNRDLHLGTFNWPLRISSMDGKLARDIEATVDTGAAYTTVPAPLLRELGVVPMGKRKFLLADGRRIEMDYGQAWATIDGDSVVTIVIFGDEEAPALLGAYTLEGLSLAVDPVEQRLVPTHLIMY